MTEQADYFLDLPLATAAQLRTYLDGQPLEPVEQEFGRVLAERLARRDGIPAAGYIIVVSILTGDCISGQASMGHRLPEILRNLDTATYMSVGWTATRTWGIEAFGEDFAQYMRIAQRRPD